MLVALYCILYIGFMFVWAETATRAGKSVWVMMWGWLMILPLFLGATNWGFL